MQALVALPNFNPRVSRYVSYHRSVSVLKLGPACQLTLGVKKLSNPDPPFAITDDGKTGARTSWGPRVAVPRGRSFNVNVEGKF